MRTVQVFHNVSRDASFGLNTVFTPAGARGNTPHTKAQATGYDEMHPLVLVFEFEIDAQDPNAGPVPDDMQVCEYAWQAFNVGHDPEFTDQDTDVAKLAHLYRARKLRSLSKGDVLVIDDQAYSCQSVGWAARSPSELRIVEGTEAETVIRSRYEIGADEPLSVTVPASGLRTGEERA